MQLPGLFVEYLIIGAISLLWLLPGAGLLPKVGVPITRGNFSMLSNTKFRRAPLAARGVACQVTFCPFTQKIDHEETKGTKEEQKKSSFSS